MANISPATTLILKLFRTIQRKLDITGEKCTMAKDDFFQEILQKVSATLNLLEDNRVEPSISNTILAGSLHLDQCIAVTDFSLFA